jgi:hypothetical protein
MKQRTSRMLRGATSLSIFACLAAAVGAAARSSDGPPVAGSSAADQEAGAPTASPFDNALRAIAAEYATYERVSDRVNFAPTACLVPRPSGVVRSVSPDEGTHGRKLYFLYVKDARGYEAVSWPRAYDKRGLEAAAAPVVVAVGQVVVKQTWSVRDVPPDEAPAPNPEMGQHEFPPEYARDGDGLVRTGERRELFVMMKLDPATPGTDAGWVYAVLTPDDREVIQAGAIESCMGCHTRTTRDRLYGHPESWPTKDGTRVPPLKDADGRADRSKLP